MSRCINKVQILGYVGADPKITHFNNNKTKVCLFSVATTTTWKDRESGEFKNSTQWHNVVIYNPYLIEYAQKHVKKGSLCLVEGELKSRKATIKNTDHEYNIYEIVLKNYHGELIVFPKDAKSDSENTIMESHFKDELSDLDDMNDDIPF